MHSVVPAGVGHRTGGWYVTAADTAQRLVDAGVGKCRSRDCVTGAVRRIARLDRDPDRPGVVTGTGGRQTNLGQVRRSNPPQPDRRR